jgi:hypothetical protein
VAGLRVIHAYAAGMYLDVQPLSAERRAF